MLNVQEDLRNNKSIDSGLISTPQHMEAGDCADFRFHSAPNHNSAKSITILISFYICSYKYAYMYILLIYIHLYLVYYSWIKTLQLIKTFWNK